MDLRQITDQQQGEHKKHVEKNGIKVIQTKENLWERLLWGKECNPLWMEWSEYPSAHKKEREMKMARDILQKLNDNEETKFEDRRGHQDGKVQDRRA